MPYSHQPPICTYPLFAKELKNGYFVYSTLGGDMASTWVAKPEVHAEVRVTS